MLTILSAVVPLFIVIVLGFAAGRGRMFDDHGVSTLVGFVFNVALPPLLFRLLATAEIPGGDSLVLMGSYLAAGLVLFVGGGLLGAWLFRLDLSAMAIQGFGSAFPNGVFLGLPLLLSLYGEAGAAPAVLLIMIDVVFFALVTLLLELGQARRQAGEVLEVGRTALRTAQALFKNPVVLSMLAGLVFLVADIPLPAMAESTLALLGQAATPAALFALGVTLGRQRLGGQFPRVLTMASGKLFLHPLIVWLVLIPFDAFDPLWRAVVVIYAACPIGANVYIFAQRYRVAADTASTAIVLSTAASLLTLLLIPWLLSASL